MTSPKTAYLRQWHADNPTKCAEYAAKHYRANRDKRNAESNALAKTPKVRAYRKMMRSSNWKSWLGCKLNNSRVCDRIEGRENNLDIQFLLDVLKRQEYRCAATGIVLTHTLGDPACVSIDRVDSSRGHTKDNVQLVCQFYNMGKGNRGELETRSFIQKLRSGRLRCVRKRKNTIVPDVETSR